MCDLLAPQEPPIFWEPAVACRATDAVAESTAAAWAEQRAARPAALAAAKAEFAAERERLAEVARETYRQRMASRPMASGVVRTDDKEEEKEDLAPRRKSIVKRPPQVSAAYSPMRGVV